MIASQHGGYVHSYQLSDVVARCAPNEEDIRLSCACRWCERAALGERLCSSSLSDDPNPCGAGVKSAFEKNNPDDACRRSLAFTGDSVAYFRFATDSRCDRKATTPLLLLSRLWFALNALKRLTLCALLG